eukprot:c21227_g1_i1.p1 GENE.c21227_g1_i1~~c21227_g1_i1.p1  ORF type:complete len:976 (+),score=413.50 c21227_g1_i1:1749-4676(+)
MSLLDDWDENQGSTQQKNNFDPTNENDTLNTGESGGQAGAGSGLARETNCPFSFVQTEWQPFHTDIRAVVASDNVIVVASGATTVNIIEATTWETTEVEVARHSTIKRLFIDNARGRHLIVCLENGENYYIHTQNPTKVRPVLTKAKDGKPLSIECIGWDKYNITDNDTGEMLIGSLKGHIYEAQISDGKEKYLKQIYCFQDVSSVCGIQLERFPLDQTKIFVMVATITSMSTRQYQFVAQQGSFAEMFSAYAQSRFQEIPGNSEKTELHFFGKYHGVANSFGWLTGQGIFYGELTFGTQMTQDSVTGECSLLTYPPSAPTSSTSQFPPGPILSFAKTDFHFIILLPTAIIALNQVTEQIVWSHDLKQLDFDGSAGLARDPCTNKTYLYTRECMFEILVDREDRNMWRVYLQKNDFDTAVKFCKTPEQKDRVLCAKAEYYFKQNKLDRAAEFYAATSKPFEEVALKFVAQPTQDSLKTYLLSKLERTPDNENTQQILLCSWLLEIYLNKLNALRDASQMEQYSAVKDDLEEFLEKWAKKDRLNKKTAYHLIASQGRSDILLFYAMLIGDYSTVVQHHLQQKEWPKAINILQSQDDPELWYKYSPVLMENCPVETVDGWLKAKGLSARGLIPSLMRYEVTSNPPGNNTNQAIRYLKKCVESGVEDEAVLNYLLALYAKQDDDVQLMDFLTKTPAEKYDLKYALRVCTKEKKFRACTHIYMALGMFEEAVELALKEEKNDKDLEIAKQCADGPVDDEDLQKKLWLKIAKHVVDRSDHKKAIEFLKECPLLKIEDILPFFPDFVRIDLFKDEICASLQDYNTQIKNLKEDMDEATKNANQIRADINELRNRYTYLSPTQKCELSNQPVLGKTFYCFPCNHVFLQDCLIQEVLPHLTDEQRAEVHKIQHTLGQAEKREPEVALTPQETQQLKTKLDDIVASECPLCGSIMISTIDQPLYSDDDDSWTIPVKPQTGRAVA